MKNIKYVVAKTKAEALSSKDVFEKPTLAKASIPPDAHNEKWYLFAKFIKDNETKSTLVVVGYYDCVSPLGEVEDKMQWFDFMKYKDNVQAKNRFKSLKV